MTHLAKAHATYSHDWWTPPEWIKWVAKTLGSYWFDPCPVDWDGKLDGLRALWTPTPGRAWDYANEHNLPPLYVNHPGGRGQAQLWWDRFREHSWYSPGAIWCGFNLEQLRTLDPSPLQLDGWLVVPRKRIAYIDGRTGERAKSPSQATFFWLNVEPAEPPEPCIITRTA